MKENSKNKKMLWYELALMAFTTVWGFGNVVNGYSTQGMQVVISWILMFAFYFVPYALMVGELGSTFQKSGGGVSSWIQNTIGPRMAYYAGWTYWVVHIPYISQKPQSAIIAAGWAIFQDGDLVKNMNPIVLQLCCLAIFLLFVWISTRGVAGIKRISGVAGLCMFIMSMLFILLMFAAPVITQADLNTLDLSPKALMPKFNFSYITSLSILVFAVGGCEKISPYVNSMKSPSKDFPKGMIVLAIMVSISALLGTVAMGMMFDPNNIPDDLMMNGAYYAMQLLGQYYGIGNFFVIIYAITNVLTNLAVLAISVDAPLRMLLDNADPRYIPSVLKKQSKNGTLINGYILTSVLVSILIIIPALGIGDVNGMVKSLVKLNSVCMPLRYLWVFVAYIALKKAADGKFNAEYKFAKNRNFGLVIGGWCFFFTAFACIMGMFPSGMETFSSEWFFTFGLNIFTPIVLCGLGVIMPILAKREQAQLTSTK